MNWLFTRLLFLGTLLHGVLHAAPASLTFDSIYMPHMVLQREVALPVRGKAAPGAAITVEFAGQAKTTQADANGAWIVTLDPMAASAEARDLVVTAQSSQLIQTKIEDILVGDVWVASGQSNMAWQVRQSTNGKEEMKGAQLPLLRGCLVPYVKGKDEPQESAAMKWSRSDKLDEMALLSGQGYFFARELAQKLNIPIGIISVAKGGTPAEAFMRRALLESNADFKPIVERMDKFDREYPALKAAFDAAQPKRDAGRAKVLAEAKAAGKAPPPPKRLVPPDYHSRPCAIWNTMIHPLTKLPIKGVVWNQGPSNDRYTEIYAELFQALIRDWRAQWHCGEFPFIFVQIERNNHYKSMQEAPPEAGDDEWAEIREAQAKSLATPNTYMVPAFDQGEDGTNRHPLEQSSQQERVHVAAVTHVVDVAPQKLGILINNEIR
ncbi:MAG: sialate O-acetylesterase, partial [Prosthecobacter sp.]